MTKHQANLGFMAAHFALAAFSLFAMSDFIQSHQPMATFSAGFSAICNGVIAVIRIAKMHELAK